MTPEPAGVRARLTESPGMALNGRKNKTKKKHVLCFTYKLTLNEIKLIRKHFLFVYLFCHKKLKKMFPHVNREERLRGTYQSNKNTTDPNIRIYLTINTKYDENTQILVVYLSIYCYFILN